MLRHWIVVIIFLSLIIMGNAMPAQALLTEDNGRRHGHLTAQDILRVKEIKRLVTGVDAKSVQQTIVELENSAYPRLNLSIKEAMAKAYADIVKDQHVQGEKKKVWLYSMVNLNMAYLQFVGPKNVTRNIEPLDRLIRQKLKEYLPPTIFNQPGFHSSIE